MNFIIFVQQYEVSNKKIDVDRNIVRVTALERDPVAKDPLSFSFYYTKPAYFLSTIMVGVKWLYMSQKIYSKTMQKR